MQLRSIQIRGLLYLGCLLLLNVSAAAGNWPRFRGENGTGIVTDAKLPVDIEEKNILWKKPIPGDGHSSPIVWENKIFLQTASANIKERFLLCLDAKSGKTLWTQTVSGSKVHKHPKNSFASSTPATDGKLVYVSFWDGQDILVQAYDFSGNQKWNRNLGPWKSEHGAGASPIVYKDKIILANDMDGKSKLIALDSSSGKTVWETPRPAYRASYGAPFIWETPAGEPELVIVSTTEFAGYNPETGERNWNWTWQKPGKKALRVVGSPVFFDGCVYGYSGSGGGSRFTVAIQVYDDGKEPQPKLLWSTKRLFPYVPSLLSYKGNLYTTNDKGVAACFDAKTGSKIWDQRISGAPFTASPVIVDGKIYAGDEAGDLFVLNADPAFQLLSKTSLGERIRATPAVANNRLYIRGRYHLFCIGN